MEEPERPAVVGLGALPRRRRPGPPRRRGGEPKTPSSLVEVTPKRSVVALVEHLRTQAAAGGYAEAVYLALPVPIQKAATHQERPALPTGDP